MKIKEVIQFFNETVNYPSRRGDADDYIIWEHWAIEDLFSEDERKQITDKEWEYACGYSMTEFDWEQTKDAIASLIRRDLVDFRKFNGEQEEDLGDTWIKIEKDKYIHGRTHPR